MSDNPLHPQLVDTSGQPLGFAKPDPQAQRIAELEREVAALKGLCARQEARIREAEVDMLVSLAIDEGKMLPAMRQWAVELGRTSFATLQTFIADTPVMPSATGWGQP